jgi:molecular chaperone DnaK (HSP70)
VSMMWFWLGDLPGASKRINPDEAVAYGAAVQAAILNHEALQEKLSSASTLSASTLESGR